MKIMRFLVLGVFLTATFCRADDEIIPDPAWLNSEDAVPCIECNDSNSQPGDLETPQPLLSIAEAITPEIQALARGLENDPARIFDYVHDHIRHVLYFGSKKGAQLTLLERSGNDFDQCALLVSLLRAAGFTTNVG